MYFSKILILYRRDVCGSFWPVTLLKLQIIVIVYTSWSQRQDFFLHILLYSYSDNQDHDRYAMHQCSQVTKQRTDKGPSSPCTTTTDCFLSPSRFMLRSEGIVLNIFFHIYFHFKWNSHITYSSVQAVSNSGKNKSLTSNVVLSSKAMRSSSYWSLRSIIAKTGKKIILTKTNACWTYS